ncbi:MAG: transcriptional repressor [Oxalobacter sp.]|nr:transcriptional repressor [Oxalobacter sp.]
MDKAFALTKNQQLILDALRHAQRPASAYHLLETVQKEGIRAPSQVYRALEKLVEYGLAHRLESLNAFIACQHADHHAHEKGAVVFVICINCGTVSELTMEQINSTLNAWAASQSFSIDAVFVEVRGLCKACWKA